jgi:hypothetical protein
MKRMAERQSKGIVKHESTEMNLPVEEAFSIKGSKRDDMETRINTVVA